MSDARDTTNEELAQELEATAVLPDRVAVLEAAHRLRMMQKNEQA